MPYPDIILEPIGIIHTPFKLVSDSIPIQGRLIPGTRGHIHLFHHYIEGCRDIEGFSHVYLIYQFHASTEERLATKPYLDSANRGIFSTRSPHRPNHIGLSIVRLIRADQGILTVEDVDMLDSTPLLDIKPYIPSFDAVIDRKTVRTGWMDRLDPEAVKNGTTKTGSYKEWLQEKE
jgi:tRNA-Thr(GGU) m(6)t(6)A37 methyltransferase TsaA